MVDLAYLSTEGKQQFGNSTVCKLCKIVLFGISWFIDHRYKCTATNFQPFWLNVFIWLCSISWNRATGVISPSLQRLHSNLEELEDVKGDNSGMESLCKNKVEGDNKLANIDLEREDECGICLEPCTKMVLPNCCHAMCIKCYRNW
jgi:hypothetical protein